MPIGPTELIIVLVLVLIVFGVGKLPEVGGAVGRGIREFRSTLREEPTETTEAKDATESAPAKRESESQV